jgi:hypothetical protein
MFSGIVNSTSFDNLKRRLVKFIGFSKNDVQDHPESMPYGLDSNPIQKMVAIYAHLGNGGRTVVIGYINQNQLADVGEMRIYSTDSNGSLKTYVWCKNNGDLYLTGTADNAVRYSKLDQALQDQKDKINGELAKISTAIAAVGGSYELNEVTIDTTPAKITNIFTP